ncbi:MAG: hypothetical protein WC964_00845 [Acholeplasmataceae bacterium]
MARAKTNRTTKRRLAEKQAVKPISGVMPPNSKEPSPKEILFLKVGISVMVLLVLGVVIFFAIQLLGNRNNENKNPYTSFLYIYGEELGILTRPDELTGGYPYGDLEFFNDADEFPATDDYEAKAIYNLIKNAKTIYVFIYSVNDMDNDVKEQILEYQEQYKNKPLLFLQLDHPRNFGLLEDPAISHLGLQDVANQLLIFNIEPSSSEVDDFEVIVDRPGSANVNELLEAIKKIIQ